MDMEVVFPGGKRVNANYKGFTIQTDQPTSSGGENSSPSPFDLFLASLGTCAGFYVLSFCQERDIPPERVKLIMRTQRNEDTHLLEKVHIDINLPPDFPEKYRQAVLKAAQRCTVKRHLHNPPVFELKAKKWGGKDK